MLPKITNAGLKVNAKKCSFGLKEIPYLGYIIKREGVMPDPKKIQGIVDLERPKNYHRSQSFDRHDTILLRHVEGSLPHTRTIHCSLFWKEGQ